VSIDLEPYADEDAGVIWLAGQDLTVPAAYALAEQLKSCIEAIRDRVMTPPTDAELERLLARDEFLASVITTAIEGGVGYWAGCRVYRWWSPTLDGGTALPSVNGGAFAHAVLVDREDPEQRDWKVDPGTIVQAFERLAEDAPVLHVSTRTRNRLLGAYDDLEAGDIDADDADMLVQIGLFGEVVYG
jgi:hypothetical protein